MKPKQGEQMRGWTDDDLARYERLESNTMHIVLVTIALGIIVFFSSFFSGCKNHYPACDASQAWHVQCLGDDIAICDGENWSPQISCDIAGMSCVNQGRMLAVCEEK